MKDVTNFSTEKLKKKKKKERNLVNIFLFFPLPTRVLVFLKFWVNNLKFLSLLTLLLLKIYVL